MTASLEWDAPWLACKSKPFTCGLQQRLDHFRNPWYEGRSIMHTILIMETTLVEALHSESARSCAWPISISESAKFKVSECFIFMILVVSMHGVQVLAVSSSGPVFSTMREIRPFLLSAWRLSITAALLMPMGIYQIIKLSPGQLRISVVKLTKVFLSWWCLWGSLCSPWEQSVAIMWQTCR